MTAHAIDCRNLTHRYGDFTAVDDLTLQVHAGETLGLRVLLGAALVLVAMLLTELGPRHGAEGAVSRLEV